MSCRSAWVGEFEGLVIAPGEEKWTLLKYNLCYPDLIRIQFCGLRLRSRETKNTSYCVVRRSPVSLAKSTLVKLWGIFTSRDIIIR